MTLTLTLKPKLERALPKIVKAIEAIDG